MLATSLAEGVEARGARRAARAGRPAAAIGFATELAGVATGRPFGHYAYGPGLGPRVGGVPLLAAAAWAMMARPAWVVAGHLTRRRRAARRAGRRALTAWDVFLDPRMVREGYWTWARPAAATRAIPVSNFAGWLATGRGRLRRLGGARSGATTRCEGDGALALYVWTLAGETFANAGVLGPPARRRRRRRGDGRVGGARPGAAPGGRAPVRVVVVGAGAGGLAAAVRAGRRRARRHRPRAGGGPRRQGRAARAAAPRTRPTASSASTRGRRC